ncbi:hypothetical protein C8255_06480 [filamentous cyanobacterium CCP3]|nr:hypothetical protein C8255_06480 [filamentous cyanobacterium CCP3]
MGLGRRVVAQVIAVGAIALLIFTAASCAKPVQPTELISDFSEPTLQPNRLTGQIAEVSPPETLESLKQIIDAYTPQVRILSPRPGEVLDDTSATVRMQVRGLPLFKDDTYELGPHLHLFLDNEPYKAVYDISEPITFENLSPGTHTLRVFASRPWHESFKNQGAFDQRTFHVVAPTPQNQLNASAPLLTYSRPQGTYGAEPVMLDFYLTNAPLHMSAQAEANDDLHDWRIRCTINDQSFVFDQWQPIWLKGFKPGRNWVQLELIDESGNPIDNRFNNTVRIIDYQPGGDDALSQLVRGELSLKEVAGIIDPTYVPPAPEPEPGLEPEQPTEELEPEGSTVAPEVPEPQTPEPEAVPELPQADDTPTLREAEQAQPEPDATTESVPLAEPEDEARPNPFLRPEPSASEQIEADQFSADEKADDLTDAEPPAVEAPTAAKPDVIAPEVIEPDVSQTPEENAANDRSDGVTPPADPFVPPVLPQPETLPEPVPVQPAMPLAAPEQSTPQGPKAKGLRDRLKQWRNQAGAGSKPAEPGPVGEESGSPDDEAAPEEAAPKLPSVQPEDAEPDTAAPFSTEPQSPPEAELPEADSPEDPDDTNGAVEQPRVAPRSPLAPQVRPFI